MLRQNIKLLGIFTVLASVALGAVDEKASLLEELTGTKATTAKVNSPMATPAQRSLRAGLEDFRNHNYSSALKNYDHVLTLSPKGREARAAYLAKGQLYQQIGLLRAAEFNFKMAEESKKTIR